MAQAIAVVMGTAAVGGREATRIRMQDAMAGAASKEDGGEKGDEVDEQRGVHATSLMFVLTASGCFWTQVQRVCNDLVGLLSNRGNPLRERKSFHLHQHPNCTVHESQG